MNKSVVRIALVGPESSGKTTLCRALANHFETVYAHEYARGYLRRGHKIQSKEDIYELACRQIKIERCRLLKASRFLFCDTDLINFKIWSEQVFNSCDARLLSLIESHSYDLYLILRPNVAWSYDGIRAGRGDRDKIYDIYIGELEGLGVLYKRINNSSFNRLIEAISLIKDLYCD